LEKAGNGDKDWFPGKEGKSRVSPAHWHGLKTRASAWALFIPPEDNA